MNYLSILVTIRTVVRSIHLESKRIEKEYGISIPQLLVLQYLSEQDDYRAPASRIKDFLNLNASTISGIISRLEQKGLVARLPKPDDRRASYITLTAKGADLLRTSPVTLQENLEKRLSQLDDERVKELERNIDLLVSLLGADDIDASPVIVSGEMGPQTKI